MPPGTLASNLRATRLQAKLTREKLAVAADVSVASIARMESGEHTPTMSVLTRVAEALGTSAFALLDPVSCLCDDPQPNGIGECQRCYRLVPKAAS